MMLEMLCQLCLKVKNAADGTHFSFEGHCAMTNAEEANEVQENVVIVKKRKKRGIEAITDEEVAQRNRERIPVNTRKSTSWAISVWDDWAKERKIMPLEKRDNDDFIVVPEGHLLFTICDFELCFWLSKFVYDIKRRIALFIPSTLCTKSVLDYNGIWLINNGSKQNP